MNINDLPSHSEGLFEVKCSEDVVKMQKLANGNFI